MSEPVAEVAGNAPRTAPSLDTAAADLASTAAAAAERAIEVQEALRSKNAGLPEDQWLQFRIGINVGDVIEVRNMASVAEMIIDSASRRKHSIGLHFNHDLPTAEPPFRQRETVLRRPGFRKANR